MRDGSGGTRLPDWNDEPGRSSARNGKELLPGVLSDVLPDGADRQAIFSLLHGKRDQDCGSDHNSRMPDGSACFTFSTSPEVTCLAMALKTACAI